MGPHLMKRPPKFVQSFIDRHGKARFYFRRVGVNTVPLPGLPWSPEFMAVYEVALAGQPAQAGSKRVAPGTIRALCVSYFNTIGPIPNSDCVGFRSLKPSTQGVYRNIIDRFCGEKDRDGREYGDKH